MSVVQTKAHLYNDVIQNDGSFLLVPYNYYLVMFKNTFGITTMLPLRYNGGTNFLDMEDLHVIDLPSFLSGAMIPENIANVIFLEIPDARTLMMCKRKPEVSIMLNGLYDSNNMKNLESFRVPMVHFHRGLGPAGRKRRRSTAKRPTAKRPTAKRPTVKRPTVKRPTVKRPTAKRPTAKRPIVKRPTVKRHRKTNKR